MSKFFWWCVQNNEGVEEFFEATQILKERTKTEVDKETIARAIATVSSDVAVTRIM